MLDNLLKTLSRERARVSKPRVRDLLIGLYDFVRLDVLLPLLELVSPRTWVTYNGIETQGEKLTTVLLRGQRNFDTYEEGLVEGIECLCAPSDRIIIVGGGWGVSTVVALQEAGEQGDVTVYEGSKSQVREIERTVSRNTVPTQPRIRHVIVERGIELKGDVGSAEHISATELPQSDLLVLDCEGAEEQIISNLKEYPKKIVVESHGFLGSPTKSVQELLQNYNYQISCTKVANSAVAEDCREKDIFVIHAEKKTEI